MDERGKDKYLRIIYELEDSKGVKSIRLAEKLKISKPSVNEMLNKLKEDKLIKMEKYGKIFLTAKGREKAERLFDNHYIIKKFMKHVIKHNEEKAGEEAHKISHLLSEETIKTIERIMENKLEEPESILKPVPGYIG